MDETRQSYPLKTKNVQQKLQRRTKTSSRRTNNIKALLERLRSLQITEEALSNNKQTDTKMSGTLVPAAISENVQTRMPKNIVPNPRWFDGN